MSDIDPKAALHSFSADQVEENVWEDVTSKKGGKKKKQSASILVTSPKTRAAKEASNKLKVPGTVGESLTVIPKEL
ncbi:hypothetical protein TIFTF001_002371 [Ficus carica]|uniref:Uncharacterized protein n=1 Tax=Ficus carica TaxID=3494 RepID=A0AA88CTL1_FICCA|nr:hypothetical protein TIFTF001_002371 [Ficus carica]